MGKLTTYVRPGMILQGDDLRSLIPFLHLNLMLHVVQDLLLHALNGLDFFWFPNFLNRRKRKLRKTPLANGP